MTSFTDAEQNTTTWVYDDVNHTETVTAPPPFNYVIIYQYDDKENLLWIRDADEKYTYFDYYPDGRLWKVTTPLQKTTTWTYDDVLRTTTITDPLGKYIVLTYDELGRLVSREDQRRNVTRYGYNKLGRREWIRNPDGTERWRGFNCCRTAWERDELLRTTTYEPDVLNRLWLVKDNLGRTLTEYHYDDAGRRDWMKDVLGRQTIYSRDARGWLTDVIYPDTTYESYGYDKAHNMTSRTDRMRRTTTYVNDDVGRLLTKTFPDHHRSRRRGRCP